MQLLLSRLLYWSQDDRPVCTPSVIVIWIIHRVRLLPALQTKSEG